MKTSKLQFIQTTHTHTYSKCLLDPMESQEAQYGLKHEYCSEQLKMSKKLMIQLIIQQQQLSIWYINR